MTLRGKSVFSLIAVALLIAYFSVSRDSTGQHAEELMKVGLSGLEYHRIVKRQSPELGLVEYRAKFKRRQYTLGELRAKVDSALAESGWVAYVDAQDKSLFNQEFMRGLVYAQKGTVNLLIAIGSDTMKPSESWADELRITLRDKPIAERSSTGEPAVLLDVAGVKEYFSRHDIPLPAGERQITKSSISPVLCSSTLTSASCSLRLSDLERFFQENLQGAGWTRVKRQEGFIWSYVRNGWYCNISPIPSREAESSESVLLREISLWILLGRNDSS